AGRGRRGPERSTAVPDSPFPRREGGRGVRSASQNRIQLQRAELSLVEHLLAQRTLVGHAALLHDALGGDVVDQAARLDAVQAQLAEAVVDDGAGRLSRQPLSPPGAANG